MRTVWAMLAVLAVLVCGGLLERRRGAPGWPAAPASSPPPPSCGVAGGCEAVSLRRARRECVGAHVRAPVAPDGAVGPGQLHPDRRGRDDRGVHREQPPDLSPQRHRAP